MSQSLSVVDRHEDVIPEWVAVGQDTDDYIIKKNLVSSSYFDKIPGNEIQVFKCINEKAVFAGSYVWKLLKETRY